jgi:O-antigen/teichoic acid export membrane protein
VVALFAGLATSVVTARTLGPEAFGILALLQWVRLAASTLLDLGISNATTKFVSELEGANRRGVATYLAVRLVALQIGIAVVSGMILIVFADAIGRTIGRDDLSPYLPITGGVLGLSLASAVLAGYLAGTRRFGAKAGIESFSSIIRGIGVIIVLTEAHGIGGVLWVELGVGVVQVAAFGLVISRTLPTIVDAHEDFVIISRIKHYCVRVMCITTIDAIIWQPSEIFLMGRFSSNDQTAFFTIAYNFAVTSITLIPHVLGNVLFPVLSERFGARDKAAMQALYASALRFVALVAFPLCAGGIGVAPALIIFFYGTAYAPAGNVLRILLIAAAASALAAPTSGFFLAIDRGAARAALAVPTAAINIILSVLLIPSLGATGAGLSKLVAQTVNMAIDVAYLAIRGESRLPLGPLSRVALASVPVGVSAYVALELIGGMMGLAAGLVVGAAVYPFALWTLRALDSHDLAMLRTIAQSGFVFARAMLGPVCRTMGRM